MRAVRAHAPGRVNLLGEHTDYTGGLVLPLAIDRVTQVEAERRDDGVIELVSDSEPAPVRVEARRPEPGSVRWANYVLGVVAEFWDRADLRGGFRLRISGDVPVGAGLSSSASLTVACARALDDLYECRSEPLALAQSCQRAERRFAGVQCGLMDQAAASLSVPGCALYLDCRTLEHRALRLPETAVVVLHSGVHHELAASEYNRRVAECAGALSRLPGRGCLGECVPEDLAKLEGVERRRAEHVVRENGRVREGVAALERGDLAAFGRLMVASHASLRDLFEVSCPELDALVEAVRPWAWGAKMTGAGFGGAVVALAPLDRVRPVAAAAQTFLCRPYMA